MYGVHFKKYNELCRQSNQGCQYQQVHMLKWNSKERCDKKVNGIGSILGAMVLIQLLGSNPIGSNPSPQKTKAPHAYGFCFASLKHNTVFQGNNSYPNHTLTPQHSTNPNTTTQHSIQFYQSFYFPKSNHPCSTSLVLFCLPLSLLIIISLFPHFTFQCETSHHY